MHIVVIKRGCTMLMAAAAGGCVAFVELLLLQHGADVNAKDEVRNV